MRNFKQRFVSKYKDFLVLKHTAQHEPSVPLHQVVLESFVLLVLIVLFGWVFNLQENFHFILLASNLFLVGSFLLYRVKRELIFKQINRLDYSTFIGVMYDVNMVITSLSLMNSAFYVFILDAWVSLLLVIINLCILLIGSIGDTFLRQMIRAHTSLRSNNDAITLWIFALFLGIFYALGFSSLGLNYSVSFIMVLGLVVLKFFALTPRTIPLQKMLIIMLGIISITASIIGVLDDESTLGSYRKKVLNTSNHTIVLETDTDIVYAITDVGLFITHPNYVQVLDAQLSPVITLENHNHETFFMIEGVLYKTVLSQDQSNMALDKHPEHARFELYRHIEEDSFEFVSTVYYKLLLEYEQAIRFFWYDETLYYYDTRFREVFNVQGEVIDIATFFPSHGVLYETKYEILYVRYGHISWVPSMTRYHDGLILNYRCVEEFEQFLVRDRDLFYCPFILWFTPAGSTFYHHEGLYYSIYKPKTRESDIHVFDRSGTLLETVVQGQDLFHLDGTFILLERDINESEQGTFTIDTLTMLYTEHFYRYEMVRQPGLTPFIIGLWLVWLYVWPVKLTRVSKKA